MIAQLRGEHEVIVGPAQAFSPSNADTIVQHIGVGIEIILIEATRIVAVAVVAVVGTEVVLAVGIVVIAGRDIGHLAEIAAKTELIGAFSAEPVGGVAGVIALVIFTIRLCTEAQHLAIANRHKASMLFILAEEVGHREVIEFQSHTTDDTSLSPSQRELHLVVALLLEVVGNIHGSIVLIGRHIGVRTLLGIEMTHGLYLA